MTMLATKPPGRHRPQEHQTTKRVAVLQIGLAILAALVLLGLAYFLHLGDHSRPVSLPSPLSSVTAVTPVTVSPSTPSASIEPTVAQTTPTAPVTSPYTVRPGDNLTVIAAHFNVPLQTFYAENMATVGADWNLIHPGQVLQVVTTP